MTLEDRLKEQGITEFGNITARLQNIYSRVQSGQSPYPDGQTYSVDDIALIAFLSEDRTLTREELNALAGRSPTQITYYVNQGLPQALKKAKEKLVDLVEPHYKNILEESSDQALIQEAISAPIIKFEGNREYNAIADAKKDYQKWETAAKEGDINRYVNEGFKSDWIKGLISTAPSEQLKELLQQRVKIEQQRLLSYFVNEENLDKRKLINYLTTTEKNAEDKHKKAIYEQAGIYYSLETRENNKEKNKYKELPMAA